MSAVEIAGGAVAASSGASAFLAWAVRGRSSRVFGDSVWRGPSERPSVALTFDDGPSEGTPQVLDVLAGYGVQATFFQVGANAVRLPEIARAVAAAGHEVGNHSQTHPLLCFRTRRFIEDELRRAQESIEKHAGARPEWFRAPFGARWFGLAAAQRRVGLTGVMWTVIGYDWKLMAEAVAERMARSVSNGAILCLHDGRELRAKPDIRTTVEAVRRLVPTLLEKGYKFETLNRLLCPTN